MTPATIIGIDIPAVPPENSRAARIIMQGSGGLAPPTLDTQMTALERTVCYGAIAGAVNELIVASPYAYASKYYGYVCGRIIDVAEVSESARSGLPELVDATMADAMCYVDGNMWGTGDPAGTPPPNYIPGMFSSISYNYKEPEYKYPPGSTKYEGPYPGFTVYDSKGTLGPPAVPA